MGFYLRKKRLDTLVGALCCAGRGFGRAGRAGLGWACGGRSSKKGRKEGRKQEGRKEGSKEGRKEARKKQGRQEAGKKEQEGQEGRKEARKEGRKEGKRKEAGLGWAWDLAVGTGLVWVWGLALLEWVVRFLCMVYIVHVFFMSS